MYTEAQILEICSTKLERMSFQIERLDVPRLANAKKDAQKKIVAARELLKTNPQKAMNAATNTWRSLSKNCTVDEIFGSAK